MSLRQSLSPDQKFAVICTSIALLFGGQIALLYSLSQNIAPPKPMASPIVSAPVPTPAPLVFTAPGTQNQPPQDIDNKDFTPVDYGSAGGTKAKGTPTAPVTSGKLPTAAGTTGKTTFQAPTAAQIRAAKADAAFKRGTAALKAKDAKAALAAFREVVPLAPDNFPTRLNLALLYESANDPQNALVHLRVATKLQPKNAAVRFSLSRAQLALGKRKEGLLSLRETIRLAPKERASRALLAQVLVMEKRPTRAQIRESYALWSALAREDKRDVGAHLQAAALANDGLRQPKEAQKWLRLSAQNSPRDPRPSLLLAQLLATQKQPKEAARVLTTASKNRPDVFEIYGPLAEARLASGDSKGAISALQSALLRLPKAKSAREKAAIAGVEGGLRVGLGRVLGESKQPQRALVEFQKAAALLPRSGEPDSLGAISQIQLKKLAPAAQALERALKKEPKRDGDRRLLAQLYGDLKQWQKADAHWAIYSRAQPKDAEALLIWSQVAAQRKDVAGQLRIAKKLVKVAPKDPFAWTQLGLLQKRSGDKRGALASFQTLGALQPQSADAAFERAQLQGELGNSAGEMAEWKTVLKLRPDFVQGYTKLLSGARKTGKAAEARAFLVGLLAKKPENLAAISEILKFYEKANQTGEAKAFLSDLIARDPKQKSAKTILASFGSSAN